VDFIAPADLGQTRLIYNSEHKISHHGLVAIRPLPKDAVMCVCIGSSIGKVGMTCTDACATNQQINSIICSERHFPNFIYYLLNYFSEYWRGFANFGPVPILSKGRFEAIDVIVPRDRDVQQKIAAVLGLAQRAIEQQERLIALTTELKKALLHKLFTEGLRGEPQKQTEIGAVPESWKQRSLEDAGEVVYGIQAAVASNLKPVGTMILTNKNITLDGKIVLEKLNYFVLKTKRHYEIVLKTGDLLFNWRSGSKEHVGKTAYFDLAGEFVHSSFILRIRPSDKVTGRYLFYYLNFLRESGFFLKKQTFSVNAKFNKSAINELPTYLPGEEERRDIVAALDAVGKKLDTLQVKRGLLENLFRTLLHRLMTAQIRVHDLDLPELEIAQ
jgi:type I restriction enzyme S subunit